MKIKHILVNQEFEAKDLERKLNEGSQFEELAKKYSKCPSAPDGGDLGDLSNKRNRLDSDFADAMDLLKVGQISKPIRTRFGYHLIFRYE